jgi:hypothetical protein
VTFPRTKLPGLTLRFPTFNPIIKVVESVKLFEAGFVSGDGVRTGSGWIFSGVQWLKLMLFGLFVVADILELKKFHLAL